MDEFLCEFVIKDEPTMRCLSQNITAVITVGAGRVNQKQHRFCDRHAAYGIEMYKNMMEANHA